MIELTTQKETHIKKESLQCGTLTTLNNALPTMESAQLHIAIAPSIVVNQLLSSPNISLCKVEDNWASIGGLVHLLGHIVMYTTMVHHLAKSFGSWWVIIKEEILSINFEFQEKFAKLRVFIAVQGFHSFKASEDSPIVTEK